MFGVDWLELLVRPSAIDPGTNLSPNPTHNHHTLHQLWGGNPVKFLRKLDDDEITANVKAAEQYHALAAEHANEFQPFGAAYLDAEKAKTA